MEWKDPGLWSSPTWSWCAFCCFTSWMFLDKILSLSEPQFFSFMKYNNSSHFVGLLWWANKCKMLSIMLVHRKHLKTTAVLIFAHSSSVQFSHSVMSDSLRPHGLQHVGLPCPSLTPGACSNSCPLSWWCHPTISSSLVFSSCLQSFPASGSFPVSQFFAPSGQNIGVSASASVLPMNIQDWFPLGLTGYLHIAECSENNK